MFATIGGVLIQILMQGVTFTSGKVGPVTIPRALKKIAIPPLVGMIIFGCLARNFLPQTAMTHYPDQNAGYIRLICLSVILLRGGLELDFKGKGLTVVLLTLLPQVSEACAAAVASRFIFNMPWALCFAQGFTLGAVSPAVLVPSLMILQKSGYGVKKGIPTTLIAASSFDDIIAITVFGVCITIAFNEAPGGVAEKEDSIGFEVMMIGIQIIAGLVIGLGVGYAMKLFKKCSPAKTKWWKLILCLIMAFAVPIVSEITHFYESKFICIIFFGYMCYRVWGEDKPEHELAIFWMFCQPFLFGSVGAAVLFEKMQPALLGRGIAVIAIGVTARWCGTFLAGMERKYNNYERAFMAFSWIPKATVQAALGGVTLSTALANDVPEYVEFG
jgi:solute carrier family 9B (sodium/hydrogen exchanger), member 1/2